MYRTGTEHMTITEAHPYHHRVEPQGMRSVGTLAYHKGAGEYRKAYDPHCPLCRQERQA